MYLLFSSAVVSLFSATLNEKNFGKHRPNVQGFQFAWIQPSGTAQEIARVVMNARKEDRFREHLHAEDSNALENHRRCKSFSGICFSRSARISLRAF